MANDETPYPEAAMAYAGNLAQAHVRKGGNLTDLFSAFVGVVVDRDAAVGRDCLAALDRWVMANDAGM